MVDRTVVRFTGPLAVHSAALRNALLADGYTPLSANNLLRLGAHLSRWLAERALSIEELSYERITEFLLARRAEGYTHFFTMRAFAPILQYFERAGLLSLPTATAGANGATDRVLHSYSQYLQRKRCLSSGCLPVVADSEYDVVKHEFS